METAILAAPSVSEIEERVATDQPISLTIEACPGIVTLPSSSTVELTGASIIRKEHGREIILQGRLGNMGAVTVHIQHQFNPIGRIVVSTK